MKLRLLVVSTIFFPKVGGVQKYTKNLCDELKKIDENIDITILTLTDSTDEEDEGGLWRLKAHSFPEVNPLPMVSSVKSLSKGLSRDNFDVVITQCRYYFLTNLVSYFAKKRGIPCVHIEHNSCFMTHQNNFITICAYLYDIFFSRSVLNRAKEIVCISRSVQKFLVEYFSQPIKKTSIIYTGVDVLSWEGPPDLKGVKQIVWVGRVIEDKGIFYLLNAFKMLLMDGYDLNLVIVGDGPAMPKVRSLISRLGISQNVKLLGEISHIEIKQVFYDSQLFVNPSFYSEGLQLVLVEAACFGLPIITTDVGGAAEVVTNDLSGYIIPQHDTKTLFLKMKNLVDNYAIRTKFSENVSRSAKQNFCWSSSANLFFRVLKKL